MLKPKKFRKLMEEDALVCVDGCTELEKLSDIDLSILYYAKSKGVINKKEFEGLAENLLIRTRDERNRLKKRKKEKLSDLDWKNLL
jgi:hypothetical protein